MEKDKSYTKTMFSSFSASPAQYDNKKFDQKREVPKYDVFAKNQYQTRKMSFGKVKYV